MTTLSENNQWARQKQEVVQGFIDERRTLVSTVAGRGFLLAPGFLYEFETGLEINTKQKLSAVSYAILKEAVERDLKQAGLDYDLAFRTASMAWELDKQAILTAWDKELAGIKQGWAMREEALQQMAIEVSLRGSVLIDAKTAIELQAEALRAELAGLDDDTADYEVQLVRQKIVTANRKLEVIPILQQILEAEEEIIAKERLVVAKEQKIAVQETVKIGKMNELVVKETEAAGKKQSQLLPEMRREVETNARLNTAIIEETRIERLIAEEKVTSAEIMVEKAEKQSLIMGQEFMSEGKQIEVADIAIQKAEKQTEIMGFEVEGMGKEVQLAGISAEKSGKQVDLILKGVAYEVKKLELMDIAVDKSEQAVLLSEEDINLEQERIELSEIAVDKVEKTVLLKKEEIKTAQENIEQMGIKTELATQRSEAELMRVETSKTTMETLQAQQDAANTEIMAQEMAVRDDYGNKKTALVVGEMEQKLASAKAMSSNDIDVTTRTANAEADGTAAMAEINAFKQLTAKLTHFIG